MLALRWAAAGLRGRARAEGPRRLLVRPSSAPTPFRPWSGPGGERGSGRLKLRTRVAVTALLGGGLLAAWARMDWKKRQKELRLRQEQLQRVALGQGNFSLLDHRGRRRTKRDFLGSWVLLYFGFTRCPDICPDELDKMSEVVAALDLDPSLPPVQPLFITVDPERDHADALARYVRDFHPRLLGLTGTVEEVKEAGRDYRVYASRGPPDPDGDYLVDHTILIYLIDPQGLFVDYYNRLKDKEHIADSVRRHIVQDRQMRGS
ncbi:protein SCO2 homolog, mitochondrial [Corythoichthys intestinalis]|uniref:protein SCO2 homolog, mitochondrial n=1 Tax=Corythoichthys intestinalis TaxID=161448 RepID=UPI0025A62A17|nr:protein SCO2 homolog, mitochondrial [Corythoichthys intestinalis]XP_057710759.1 protein SCO2 homolog, mitochondrial [Corythoichthys intestinalis]XP_061809604.1 protein SCO2 homolog, mitochondrial-like [Nerophis lumbriciformis]